MGLKMNTKDMDNMLKSIVKENDNLELEIWATIMNMKKAFALSIAMPGGVAGALTNTYCYIGCGKEDIYFCCVSQLDVSKLNNTITIPFDYIAKVKIKKSFIPGRKLVYLYTNDGNKMKISIMSNAMFSDIKHQKENSDKFFEILSNI